MKLYVCIKEVPDTETKIKLTGDSQGVDLAGSKAIISPYDEYAIEEALRLKEKNAGSTVTAISAGPASVVERLRTALAMGCDEAIHVDLAANADSTMVSKALAAALKKEGQVDLIFTGKEAIDDGASAVSQMLAAHLDLPCVSVVMGIEYAGTTLKCKREIEGGSIEMVEVQGPALIAAHKGLNEPRYASLPNIMKAKKKEVKVLKASDLGVSDSDRRTKSKNFELPPPKQAGKKIDGEPAAQAKQLAELLRNEAKVI